MSDTTDPTHREHYWSMEHYGFADHEPTAAAETRPHVDASRSPRTPSRSKALLATAIATLALSGTVGFVAAQASADQPSQGGGAGTVQVDGPGPDGLDGPDGPDGGRDGGPRGGGR